MGEWVAIVRLEADQDPGYELVAVLKERFGASVRTQTQQAWLYEAERKPVPPMGKPPSQTTTLPRARGAR
jgi:hypothetical protein